MTPPLLVDLSHHQAEPDWAALKAGGVVGVILKATEGTGYVDPAFAPRRATAHAHGFIVGCYHFARLTPGEAAFFTRTVGALAADEFTVLDLEVAVAGVDPVAWSGAWLDSVHGSTGRWPLIYLNRSELGSLNWAPVVQRGVKLWLAAYDGNTAPVGSGAFPALTLKQFTDKATVPGITGAVDENALEGTLADLLQTGLTVADINSLTAQLDAILFELRGPAAQGWPTFRWQDDPKNPTKMTLVDYLRSIDREVNGQLDLSGRPGQDKDTAYGQVLSLRADLRALTGVVESLAQTVAALPAAQGPMACQGNPKAVLAVIGQAATAAANTA